jgi:hypothetical protein
MWRNFNYLWNSQINLAWNIDTIVNMLYDSDSSETFQSSVFLLKMCYLVQKYHSYLFRMSLPSVGINYCKRRLQWVAVSSPVCECKLHSFWPINHVNNASRIRKGRQNNFHSCTVHFDVIKSFICPTNAHLNCFKILKFTLKITINAPTCFGLTTPSSGSLQCVLR